MDSRPRRRRGVRRPRSASRRTTATSPANTPRSPPSAAADFPASCAEERQRRPLRATAGHPVTQLWYARQGIITPEMEFIAIRENLGRAKLAEMSQDLVRNDLDKQHAGSAQLSLRRTQSHELHARPSSAASPSASPPKSPPSSSATKSPPAAPSSRPTSTTPSSSR